MERPSCNRRVGCFAAPCYLSNNFDSIPPSRYQFPDNSEPPSTRWTQARILLCSPATNSAPFLIRSRMVCREYIRYGAGTAPCRSFTWDSITTGTYIIRCIHKWGLWGFFMFMSPYSPSLIFLDQALWRPRGPEIWNSSSNTKLPCPSPIRRCFRYLSSLTNCSLWLCRRFCLWRNNRHRNSKYRGLVDNHKRRPTKWSKGSSFTQCTLHYIW